MISVEEAKRREGAVAASARKRAEEEFSERLQTLSPDRVRNLETENANLRRDLQIERGLNAAGLGDSGPAWRSRIRELLTDNPGSDVADAVDLVRQEREAELGRVRALTPVQIGSPGTPPAEERIDPTAEAVQLTEDLASPDPLVSDRAFRRGQALFGRGR